MPVQNRAEHRRVIRAAGQGDPFVSRAEVFQRALDHARVEIRNFDGPRVDVVPVVRNFGKIVMQSPLHVGSQDARSAEMISRMSVSLRS